ncbi:hypothetical protein RSOLAG22IIIB_11013 [Rhizoctonia solani]|uniref:Hemerythrin-like domain-containing protein n=1 Tax=Rhizoctonia solani TaxID=456999 RepID=A0A0K6G746_9AGAM|nr:hypothetical protein RSOLAG22IIIB_11013 [Rhizoctonia solani]
MSVLPVIPTMVGTSADLATMDYADAYSHDTTFMHNTLIRAFNQIGAKAMKIPPPEIIDFATYVDAFCETLRRHCEGENTIIFPRISAHTSLNGEDNAALLSCLERVEQWVRDTAQLPEKADPTELVAAMEVMAPVFSKNMHEQPKHMSPSVLRSALSGPELRDLVNTDIAWVAQNSRMEYLLPFLVLHHDISTNEAWPGLPEMAKKALPELAAVNLGCWKYAPFTLREQLCPL